GAIGDGENIIPREIANACRNEDLAVGPGDIGVIDEAIGIGSGAAAIDADELETFEMVVVVVGHAIVVGIGSWVVVEAEGQRVAGAIVGDTHSEANPALDELDRVAGPLSCEPLSRYPRNRQTGEPEEPHGGGHDK